MRVPAKYLFYDGLPNANDIDKIMAQGGYHSLPPVDTSNYQPVGDMTDHIPGPGWGTGPNVKPTNASRNYPGLAQGKGIDIDSVQASVGMPGEAMNLGVAARRPNMDNNPNGFGQYFNAGLAAADSLIPGERIYKNYVTQPLPVYNPYQYGTGSQAIMEDGGYINPGDNIAYAAKSGWLSHAVNPAHKGWCTPLSNPHCTGHRRAFALRAKHHNLEEGGEMYDMGGVMDAQMYGRVGGHPMDPDELRKSKKHGKKHKGDDGIMLQPYDMDTAKSGIHIKPSHKGRFTAYKKRTGKTTEEALHSSDPHVRQMANFARNAKKWHHGENGIMLYPYDIEMADDGIMLQPYDMDTAASGSHLTADKAKEMLRDGTAQGHKLTKKQKRYFGYIAGGGTPKAPDGTQIPTAPPGFTQGATQAPTPSSRGDAYLLDEINKTLTGGQRPSNTNQHYTPQEWQQLSNAYTWNQVNGNKANPKSNIQRYFSRPVNPNDPADYYRGRLNAMGQGALSMYNSSPDVEINPLPQTPNNPIQAMASMAHGGFVPGSVHDLSEEQIASLLKAGHRIEYL